MLKKVNPDYKTAHFGKWAIGVHPSELGYDQSDGMTGNKDGVFNYKARGKKWQNNVDENPKKIFSITARAISFLELQAILKQPFFFTSFSLCGSF